jgi:hypothetical protein
MKGDLDALWTTVDALRRASGAAERRRTFELADGVIRHVRISAPGLASYATMFQVNPMTTNNVFGAATRLGPAASRLKRLSSVPTTCIHVAVGLLGPIGSPSRPRHRGEAFKEVMHPTAVRGQSAS